MIKCKNIAIGYRQPLFEVENLTLDKGQLISLIGPNGSGKTTFLNTILGITELLSGELTIDDEKVTELSRAEKVKTFSHVSSKFDGVNHLTVYELIAMGRSPYTNMLNQLRTIDKDRVSSIIEQLNLTDLQNEFTTNISDGERQIAMIGKALAQETKVIVLDEPTAYLDYSNRLKVMKILKNVAHEHKKLILLSTHNIELCLTFSDLILAVETNSKKLKTYVPKTPQEKLIEEIFEK